MWLLSQALLIRIRKKLKEYYIKWISIYEYADGLLCVTWNFELKILSRLADNSICHVENVTSTKILSLWSVRHGKGKQKENKKEIGKHSRACWYPFVKRCYLYLEFYHIVPLDCTYWTLALITFQYAIGRITLFFIFLLWIYVLNKLIMSHMKFVDLYKFDLNKY